MLKRWWKQWPGRLESELEALKSARIPFERDIRAFQRGKLVLHLQVSLGEELVRLEALFPDVYPYTRFELIAPDLALPHHQNPISKNLCLIGRASGNWNASDILADFLVQRFPIVVEAALKENRSEVAGLEEHQAEPISDYYQYQSGASLLIDGDWILDKAATEGELVIGIHRAAQKVVRGAVLEVRDRDRNILAQANDDLRGLYSNAINGIWFRCNTPPTLQKPAEIYDALRSQRYPIQKAQWHEAAGGRIQIIGLVFPEESAWRTSTDGWLFLIRLQHAPKGFRSRDTYYLARAGRAGRSDLAVRVPELKPLSKKRIAVVGLGCVGAPSVLEFARAGVGDLRLLDHDSVEPGTVTRWPLGLAAAGMSKPDALKLFIGEHYPYTKVATWTHMVGSAFEQKESDLRVLDDVLRDIDLLYDATAEVGIQHLLSDLAQARQITYVSVSTTPGGWGGRVARIRPELTKGCWMCLQHAEDSGPIPPPPGDPSEPVQPAGCAAPTFTGAGFDIMEVVLTGVRLSVATLCAGTENCYPDFKWDVGILSLRDSAGDVIPPHWATFDLERHPSCEVCKNK